MTNNKFFKTFTKYQSTLINIGAAIVIVGLIFKINHYKGAEIGIAIGLGTEALLFLILGIIAFANPDEEEVKGPKPGPTNNGDVVTNLLDTLDAATIAKLETGLKNFADKVTAISAAADTAAISNEFAAKLQTASASFDQLNATVKQLEANLSKLDLASIDTSLQGTSTVQEEVAKLSKNLAALNAVYGNMLTAMNQPRN
jgi:hypothetical protein